MAYRCIPLQLLTLLGMSSTQMSPPPQRMRSRSNSSWLHPNSWSHWLNWNRWMRRPTAMMTRPSLPLCFLRTFFWMFFVDVFSIVLRLVFLYKNCWVFSNSASLGARMQWMLIVDLDRLAPYMLGPATSHLAINPSLKGPGSHRKKGGPSDRSQQSFGLLPHLGGYFFEVLGIDWVRMFSIKPSKGWYSTPQSPSHSKKNCWSWTAPWRKKWKVDKKRLLSWSR